MVANTGVVLDLVPAESKHLKSHRDPKKKQDKGRQAGRLEHDH